MKEFGMKISINVISNLVWKNTPFSFRKSPAWSWMRAPPPKMEHPAYTIMPLLPMWNLRIVVSLTLSIVIMFLVSNGYLTCGLCDVLMTF